MQTAVSIDRQNLIRTLERLPDRAIQRIQGYIERVSEEEKERQMLEEIDAEIASLEARYGTTPNAETIAAIKEAEAGIGERVTLEEIKAECDALRY